MATSGCANVVDQATAEIVQFFFLCAFKGHPEASMQHGWVLRMGHSVPADDTNLCTTRTRPRRDLSVTWPSQGTFPRSHPSARGPALTRRSCTGVHTGARIAAAARPQEVLASGTVRDLVAGSGIRFDDRGSHVLKGVLATGGSSLSRRPNLARHRGLRYAPPPNEFLAIPG